MSESNETKNIEENSQSCNEYIRTVGIDSLAPHKMTKAWQFANDCRKFEIEHFWKRGTYYWAYITGTTGAYGAILFHLIDKVDPKNFSLLNFIRLPFFSKILLCILSSIIFLFSLAWTIINKGSKFWQKSWEAHLISLEETVVGNIYKTFLDTEKEGSMDPSIISTAPYNYSVSKITMLCSIIVTILTGFLVLFHIILLFITEKQYWSWNNKWCKLTCAVFLIIVIIAACWILITSANGNTDKTNTNKYEWKTVSKV